MTITDYVIILLYVIGIVGAGMVFSSRMKSTKDMFSAGGKSPWWVSGISGFMTMFSAGTFVVWGGVAYRYGFVAVAINMCYGVAAMLVGWYLAGRWRRLGVSSAAEFLQLRFGGSIVQFYTWFQGTIGIFAVGGAIYALAKIICALIALPEGHLLVDVSTGMLSVSFVSIALCLMVILIAFSGGLWAVLMTDVLQFVILVVSVIFVVPLILHKVGGWTAFMEQAPEGFTHPIAGDFTWWFLTGWIVIHFFKIGGEWGFVQRFTCVPSVSDARKSAFIFGAMYLVSPIFWMLPPLVFRVLQPGLDFEQAYILSCQSVLPAGMMGLMVAAMASATASAATTQLNVFAGAFTTEVYQKLFNKTANESQLVSVGRILTVVLGLLVMAGALLIPRYGYTSFIIDITTLLTGPLVLPTIWGLYSTKIGMRAVWITTFMGFLAAVVVKFGFADAGLLTSFEALNSVSTWITEHSRLADLAAGILVPLAVLVSIELSTKGVHPGVARLKNCQQEFEEEDAIISSTLPAKMICITLAIIGLVMGVLAIVNGQERLILSAFAAVLLAIALLVFVVIKRRDDNSQLAVLK